MGEIFSNLREGPEIGKFTKSIKLRMLIVIIAAVAIVSLALYFVDRTRERGTLTTITGEYQAVGHPCTTRPCLPGIVYAVYVDDECYYLTVEGSWIGENLPWDGYKPKE